MYMKATPYMDVLPYLSYITDTGGRDDAFALRCSGVLVGTSARIQWTCRDDAFAPRCSDMLWKSIKC